MNRDFYARLSHRDYLYILGKLDKQEQKKLGSDLAQFASLLVMEEIGVK